MLTITSGNSFCLRIKILLTLTFIITVSCNKLKEDGFRVYTISEGGHRSNALAKAYLKRKLDFYAKFDSSAIYTSEYPENQEDVNKLMGFSDCNSHHHKNSARFGWRWFNNQLEILSYTYVSGKRDHQFIKAIEIGTEHYFHLSTNDRYYRFIVDETVLELDRKCKKSGLKYKLYPYFGGDECAPHTIKVYVKEC